MRATSIFFAILLCFINLSSVSAHTQPSQSEKTLCDAGEEVYFSCPLDNGKMVSVCALNNADPSRGYVKYKYGVEGDIFTFPRKNTPPNEVFTVSDVSEGSVRGLHLKFANGKYTYVISSVWPGELYVRKNGRIIFDKECGASRYKSFSNKVFDGIRQVPVSEVDMH